MHWLETQVQRLIILVGRGAGHGGHEPFVTAIREIVDRIAQCDLVSASFCTHEGLLFAAAGRSSDFDALAAMAQSALVAAKETAAAVSLGRPEQVVIVGHEHKLALIPIGPLTLGILAPVAVDLARSLETSPPLEKETPMSPSLLVEIGGREAVEGAVALFYERIAHDAELSPFFRGVSLPRQQQILTDFFCAALGREPWPGRSMRAVHAGMGITDRHFDRTLGHLSAALEAAGVPAHLTEEVGALVASLRPDIVTEVHSGTRRA